MLINTAEMRRKAIMRTFACESLLRVKNRSFRGDGLTLECSPRQTTVFEVCPNHLHEVLMTLRRTILPGSAVFDKVNDTAY